MPIAALRTMPDSTEPSGMSTASPPENMPCPLTRTWNNLAIFEEFYHFSIDKRIFFRYDIQGLCWVACDPEGDFNL
jgi:hypothetical protein